MSVVTSKSDLLGLYCEWQELLDQCTQASVFLTWEWISTWFSHFGNNCALRIIVARASDDGSILGIAPLAIYTTRLGGLIRLRELGFAGRELAPDHLDLLIRTGHEHRVTIAFRDWIRETAGEWDVLLLDGLTANSQLVPLLTDGPRWQWHHRHEIVCPFLALPDDASAWLSGLKKKRRYKIRRSRRQLQAVYPNQVRISCIEAESELSGALSTLIRLHRNTRSARHTGNAFSNHQYVAFHRQLCALFLQKDWLRLYLLHAGEHAIAAAYCFRYRNTVSFYSTGYRDTFSSFSPGLMLIVHIIEQSILEGAARLDFLRGDETYKFIFAQECLRDLQIRLPSSLAGQLVTRLYHLGRERIRPGLRSLISSHQ